MPKGDTFLRKGSRNIRKKKIKRRIEFIKQCRKLGWTWTEIGYKLGVSRQAAHALFKEYSK